MRDYQWAEDDFDLPYGVSRLGLSEPVSDGNYIMYHGTTRQNAQSILATGFRQSADGMLGRGVYLSRDLEKASHYPINHPESDRVVIKVTVNVGKVTAISRQGHPRQKTWHDFGYDTAWVPPGCGMMKSNLEVDCVWDPKRIKIIKTIKPSPLPAGVGRLDLPEPVSNKNYIMYHGTTRQNAQAILATGFRQSAGGMLGCGVYLSRDLHKASRYPLNYPEFNKIVIRVEVNVGQVIAINRPGHPRQKTWHDSGYDTAWVPPGCGMVPSGLEEDCVWDPDRIKIVRVIEPQPVQAIYGVNAWGYIASSMQYHWAEDCFELPAGVGRLDLPEPESDKNYIMYHGTTRQNAQAILTTGFRQSADGILGRGVYLSRDLQKASRFPIGHPEFNKVVIRVLVNVGQVISINRQGHPRQKTWHDFGYNSAWVPPRSGLAMSDSEEDCVWDPDQIKIIRIIEPQPVQAYYVYGAQGYMFSSHRSEEFKTIRTLSSKRDTDTNMSQYQWAEDDFDLPLGVGRLGLSDPVSDGNYIMYHGTTSEAAQAILATGFRQSADGMLGRGVYLSRDLEKASRYPLNHPESDRVVVVVEVNVGKVIAINRQGHPRQKTWHDHGYDTAWVPPRCGMVPSGLEEDCVWDPKRIQIIKTIKPRPVQPSVGCGSRGYM
ncbi:uncharacterized protein LOC119917990 [Micropterus salmoides]|uniref:uncharacterized protein LOC119917990 n=1 Tax=Micropterus salmoides TaxID=27706 RepID=UPI0018EB6200|nr:uncharacterized protein LOC119917990 [Micropterus salmoides]